VRDTATLVIDGRAILLAGIEGVGGVAASTLQDFVSASGDQVSCTPAPGMNWYFVCHLADGTDLAMLSLVNGAARTAAGAPDAYRVQQDDAVRNQRGIWGLQPPCMPWAVADSVATVAFTDDADEGLYFVAAEPFVVVLGEPLPVVFQADVGWGYWDGEHHWYPAPDRWRRHLENVYPHGRGLRCRTADARLAR
jgi:hypothetical protein